MSKPDCESCEVASRGEAVFWGGVFCGALGTLFLLAILGVAL